MKIKTNDKVIILSGKDRGKTGKVTRALPKENRVVVEGINIKKVHRRPRKQGQKGEVVPVAMPLHVSNVAILDPKENKPTRISRKDGVRITKKSGTKLA